jgi:DNA polymerase III subunit gamma/tau
VLDTAESLAEHDPKAALLSVQRLSDSGRDFTQFMRDLSAHLRHLFVVQTLGEVPESFSVTAEHTDRLASQAERFSQGEILRAIDFLAAAIAAVKDGSEPRIQLEMALLKATQPQADMSLQALMFRIEQLEGRVDAPTAAAPAPGDGGSAAPPRAAGGERVPRGAPAAAAVAAEPDEELDEEPPTPALELERLEALWPAVAETVAEQNGMLGAALAAARPVAVEGDRLTVAFPSDAAFVKKKAEAGRDLIQGALRGLTGHTPGLAFELSESAAGGGPATLEEAELIERLRAEFGAEEVFDTDEEQ